MHTVVLTLRVFCLSKAFSKFDSYIFYVHGDYKKYILNFDKVSVTDFTDYLSTKSL